jgi:uncharacterized protein YbjT (DUF2867 family)
MPPVSRPQPERSPRGRRRPGWAEIIGRTGARGRGPHTSPAGGHGYYLINMVSNKTILVTGATGSISSLAIPQLLAAGAKVRTLVRNAYQAKGLAERGVQTVVGDFDNPAQLQKAFDGVPAAFLLTAAGDRADAQARNAIAAARKVGNTYIVRLSVIKAGPDAPTANTRNHGQTEQDLKDSGLPVAILRPHYFMQNIFGSAQTIAAEGVFYQGMGDGRLAMIDVRDIADCAAKVLLDQGHAGKIYTLTGPESITWHKAAEAFTAALGRPVRYVPIPPEGVADAIRKMGWGEWGAQVTKDYSAAYGRGWGDFVTGDVQKLAGHTARSIEQFAREVLAPALSKR